MTGLWSMEAAQAAQRLALELYGMATEDLRGQQLRYHRSRSPRGRRFCRRWWLLPEQLEDLKRRVLAEETARQRHAQRLQKRVFEAERKVFGLRQKAAFRQQKMNELLEEAVAVEREGLKSSGEFRLLAEQVPLQAPSLPPETSRASLVRVAKYEQADVELQAQRQSFSKTETILRANQVLQKQLRDVLSRCNKKLEAEEDKLAKAQAALGC